MKITRITEKNIDHFREGIGDYYGRGDYMRQCIGLMDDEENAVGVAVIDMEEGDAMIRYFAIADEHRGKGYGRYFIREIVKSLNPAITSRVVFCEFEEQNATESEAMQFLSKCGFTIEQGGTRRSLYNMDRVNAAFPFGKGKLSPGQKIVRGAAADEALRARVKKLEEEFEGENGYIDSEFILSRKNKYGGIIVENGEIRAMIGVERFGEGARLDGIYVAQGTTEELLYLFDYAIDAINVEEVPRKTLYIDTNGEKLMAFEDSLMKKKKIDRKKSFTDRIAWIPVESIAQ